MLCVLWFVCRGLLLERVRTLVASKEKLVYALSHELRAPINGMLGKFAAAAAAAAAGLAVAVAVCCDDQLLGLLYAAP